MPLLLFCESVIENNGFFKDQMDNKKANVPNKRASVPVPMVLLESYGYEMSAPRSGSSHYTFRKQGCMPITVPKHEPIKKVYVEMVKQIVESEAKNDEDAE